MKKIRSTFCGVFTLFVSNLENKGMLNGCVDSDTFSGVELESFFQKVNGLCCSCWKNFLEIYSLLFGETLQILDGFLVSDEIHITFWIKNFWVPFIRVSEHWKYDTQLVCVWVGETSLLGDGTSFWAEGEATCSRE